MANIYIISFDMPTRLDKILMPISTVDKRIPQYQVQTETCSIFLDTKPIHEKSNPQPSYRSILMLY